MIFKKKIYIYEFKIPLKSTFYTCKQPLIIAYERSESARDNFGKFIHQLQPETKTPIRKLERILIKLYSQSCKVGDLFQ